MRATESTRGWTARDATVQAATAIGAAATYFIVRVIVEGDRATATSNAERLLDLERAIGLDIELGVQDLVVDRPVLRAIGNFSYVWFHWPLLIVFSCLVFMRSREQWRRLLLAFMASGALGLVFFTLLPVAPPRFLEGYEGTVSDAARRHYLDYPLSWTNQVASFPSFHIGWTLIACLALASTVASSTPARTRALQILVMVPAVAVGLAVVTTGNHYLLDAIAGTVIALGFYLVIGRGFGRPFTARSQPDATAPTGTDEDADRA